MCGELHCCKQMHAALEDELILFDERYDDYVIPVRASEGASIVQRIDYCPWCGVKLPDSLRSKWFDELEAMGIDPMHDAIPLQYKSGAWKSKSR